jgi:tRNA G18 (ribose-2'-O)-methylase SpoU
MKARKLSLEELDRLEVADFKTGKKTPVVVVLDDIRSALNVGSFFRTCDALAIDHLYLCGITAKPPHKEIFKTAIGATESVSWSYHESVTALIDNISTEHLIISVEQTDNSVSLDNIEELNWDESKKLCLIFGNEVKGVSTSSIVKSDHCLEIPQFGTKHSFNVAVCGGIVLWECWKWAKSVSK